jgi:D-glycerate 3-kinase
MAELSQQTGAWVKSILAAERLPDHYADTVLQFVAPLAERIRSLRHELARPVVLGISGAQGAGKSTFAVFLSTWLQRETGLSTACFSIDDIYFGKAARARLSRTLHPLFATRGVPGTHDTELGEQLLDALTCAGEPRTVALPAFDKASDDRRPEPDWPRVEAPVDVVLFEGWCVGARPQPAAALQKPVNELEAHADADGSWRRIVNARLGTDYAELFSRLDHLLMLRVPSFDTVLEWRALQERKLRDRLSRNAAPGSPPPGQDDAGLRRFIRYYERLTRHMLETMPSYADTVIDLDTGHVMTGQTDRDRPPS